MEPCKFKVGDRVFYEYYTPNTEGYGFSVEVSSAIVKSIKPSCYLDDEGKHVKFYMLEVGHHCVIEDYNCLPYDDPRVQKDIEKWKEHDAQREVLFKWVSEEWYIPYDNVEEHIKWLLNGES